MEVGGVSSSSLSTASNAPQVKVLNSQRDQLEAVVGTLLEGVAATPKLPPGKGGALNIKA